MSARHRALSAAASTRRDATAWLLLLLTLPLHGRVPLGLSGRELGVSLFDAVFWGVFLWRWHEGKIAREPRVAMAAAAAVALILLHSLMRWRLGHIELASLLRETVKYAAFPVYVAAATLMLGERRLPGPPLLLAAIGAVLIAAVVLVYVAGGIPLVTLAFRHGALERGVYANILAGLLVLTVYAAETSEGVRGRWVMAELVALIAVAAALQLYNKGVMVVATAVALMLPAAPLLLRQRREVALIALTLALVIAAATMLFAFDVLRLGIGYEGGIAASVDVRHDLWLKAIRLIAASFPWGIGLGQFGAASPPIVDALGMPQLFVHDTPLAMIAEQGAVGLALLAALACVIFRAACAFPLLTALAFALYCLETFLLNDGLGYRTAFLLFGLGLARSRSNRAAV